MALVPGILPSDSCYGTPQDLLELFAQYLEIPAVSLQSKVFFDTVSPTDTQSIWVDTTTALDPVIKIFIGGTWTDYIANYLKQRPSVTVASNDYVLVSDTSDSGNAKRGLVSDIASLAVPGPGSITYPMLSNSVTEADNVQQRVAKVWAKVNPYGATIYDDFNVSSITVASNSMTLNYSANLGNTNYCTLATLGPLPDGAGRALYVGTQTVSAVTIGFWSIPLGTVDGRCNPTFVACFGE